MSDYTANFNPLLRWRMNLNTEMWTQWVYLVQMTLHGLNATVRLALQTIYWALTPVAGVFYALNKVCTTFGFSFARGQGQEHIQKLGRGRSIGGIGNE